METGNYRGIPAPMLAQLIKDFENALYGKRIRPALYKAYADGLAAAKNELNRIQTPPENTHKE